MPDALLAVPLPHLGVSVEEATVIAWHRAPGDAVREGEHLCDVATDKVDTEITAPADGVLARIAVEAGETVPVGTLLAELRVGEVGEGRSAPGPPASAASVPAPSAPTASAPGPSVVAPSAPAVSAPRRFDPVAAAEAVVATAAATRGRGPVTSPLARRLAAEHDIDLAALTGTGLRGRIGRVDVLSAVRARDAGTPAASATATAIASAPTGGATAAPAATGLPRGYDDVPHRVVPTSRRRQAIAAHMIRSRQTAAHMSTEAEVDMSAAGRARDVLGAAPGRRRPTHLALVARVACAVLADFPDLNATFTPEQSIRWDEVNLGIAVDTPEGLIVPVIRGCERLTAPAIADAIADVAARARAGTLTPDDLRAGTFTISNPGSAGGYSAMAIINQPQVAILGTPRIVRRPTVVTDEDGGEAIGIRPIMNLTLTFDHRAVDGAEATRCVVRMKDLLEAWSPEEYA